MKSIGTLENNVETLYNIFKPALPKPWEAGSDAETKKRKSEICF